jgi:hypothetical protein
MKPRKDKLAQPRAAAIRRATVYFANGTVYTFELSEFAEVTRFATEFKKFLETGTPAVGVYKRPEIGRNERKLTVSMKEIVAVETHNAD